MSGGTVAALSHDRLKTLAVCTFLLLAAGLVFGQTVRQNSSTSMTIMYVYQNPHVSRGLTCPGIAWAFTQFHARYWIPLTRLSAMLDCQLYGSRLGDTI